MKYYTAIKMMGMTVKIQKNVHEIFKNSNTKLSRHCLQLCKCYLCRYRLDRTVKKEKYSLLT